MTLDEERGCLAAAIRSVRAETAALYEELNRRHPQSFFEQEQRAHHNTRIARRHAFHEEPLLGRLVELMATEERDGLCFLNPPAWEHRMAAEKLIEERG